MRRSSQALPLVHERGPCSHARGAVSGARRAGDPVGVNEDLRRFSEIDETAAFEVCVGLLIDYEIPLSEELLSRIHEFDVLLFDEDIEDLDTLRSSTVVE